MASKPILEQAAPNENFQQHLKSEAEKAKKPHESLLSMEYLDMDREEAAAKVKQDSTK